jgi:NitT/TauT family transport system substrate-binding protein
MQVNDMPEALRRGEIDAFAAWEPAPSVALASSSAHRIVFRGLSSDYFVIGKAFARRAPSAADELVAAYVRAIEWMRLSQKNIEKAAAWVKADALRFSGKPSELPLEQIVSIVRRELLNVPSAPTIIRNQKATPPLKGEFDFLLRLGKVPAGSRWDNVAEALNNDFLVRVQTDPRRFETYRFDYRD